ncbi:MAG: YraN family protein [Planctomycetia bacterium]|nr:YraN family protein [Planctomycetia bacterium]
MLWESLKKCYRWISLKFKSLFEEDLSPLREPIPYPPELLANRDPLGPASERIARFYLEHEFGMRCIGQNIQLRYQWYNNQIRGEIDLIMELPDEEKTLVIVEVRSRSKFWEEYPTPVESVNKKKRNRIRTSVWCWLQQNQISCNHPLRFDIIGIIWPIGELPDIHYYPNAFTWETFKKTKS